MVTQKVSTDLDVGRRPELKSDEFCGVTTLVNQLMSLLCLKPPKQVVQLLAARPRYTPICNFFHVYSPVHEICAPAAGRECEVWDQYTVEKRYQFSFQQNQLQGLNRSNKNHVIPPITAHCALRTAHCALRTAYYSLLTAHCILLSA